MWIFTKIGFFSIVEKPEDHDNGELTVRARVRTDLEELRKTYIPDLGPITDKGGTDYRYRAKSKRENVVAAIAHLVGEITYPNFKNEVATRQGQSRATLYGDVWSVLYSMQSQTSLARTSSKRTGKAIALGGVLIDDHQRILLRRPECQFDGYVWTFPKGRPDTGETPNQTALREVREETGYEARILGSLDGSFEGGTTVNRYFIMTPVYNHGDFDPNETAEVRWFTLSEAEAHISKTTNAVGRVRDLSVLQAVRKKLGQ